MTKKGVFANRSVIIKQKETSRMMKEYAPSPPRDLDKELCQLLSDLRLLYTPQQVTGMMKVTDKPRFLWKHRNTGIQMRLWHTRYRTGEPWLHLFLWYFLSTERLGWKEGLILLFIYLLFIATTIGAINLRPQT